MKTKTFILGRAAPLPILIAGACLASAESPQTPSVADLSLEDLVNVKVTSVSRKEEIRENAAASIFVLSNEELRRSGVTTLADALRLVPGLQVAAMDSSTWAISARGFNSQFANKLLVMIDGRSVYSPLFSGVYWDAQQPFLDDLDRIEIIRGPGASIWGANAVNGVINILTKSSRETHGTLLYGGGGDLQMALGGVRYGGKAGSNTWYRVYGEYQLNGDFQQANGASVNDNWDLWKGGFRTDYYTSNDGQLTWQGDLYAGNLADRTGEMSGANTLGRWTQHLSERSSYEFQAYLDHTYRDDYLAEALVDTADLAFQHNFGLGERNDASWGLGYRFNGMELRKANSPTINLLDRSMSSQLFSAFIQDELSIVPDKLTLTPGARFEHNGLTGFEFQPSVRLVYKLAENQTLWAAASRAVRTPSQVEGENLISFVTGAPLVGPGGGLYLPTYFGNTEFDSEKLWAYELGYRIQPNNRLNLDINGFYNSYDDLAGDQPVAFNPAAPFGVMKVQSLNSLHGESYGSEAVVTFSATDSWRLSASYSLLMLSVHGEPAGVASGLEKNAPTHQAVLRSAYHFTKQLSLDAQLRYVDNVQGVPAYATADLRLSYRPIANLEFSVVGQNLFDDRHPEQASLVGLPTVEVPRRIYGKVTWKF